MLWDIATEDLLESLVDEAQLLHRLHKRCYEYYETKNTWWTLPVIILSVVSGSGNFISQSFPTIEKEMIISIGGLSVMTSIISSISQYLKLAALSEGNRIAMLSWSKFYFHIRSQIKLRQRDREDCSDFIKSVMGEYQRLQEVSPNIPESMITSYRRRINFPPGFKIPHWFNGVEAVEAFHTPENTPDERSVVQLEAQPLSIDSEANPDRNLSI